MKSWKARLLILATMLAMLIALAVPASADDWEDVVEFCAETSDTWEEFEDCLEWFEERDEEDAGSGDTSSGDAGSGDTGSGYDYYPQPYYWDWPYYY